MKKHLLTYRQGEDKIEKGRKVRIVFREKGWVISKECLIDPSDSLEIQNIQQFIEGLARKSRPLNNNNEDSDEENVETEKVYVTIRTRAWAYAHDMVLDRSDPAPLERVAKKYLMKGTGLFNDQFKALTPDGCSSLLSSIELSSHNPTIYLSPRWEMSTANKKHVRFEHGVEYDTITEPSNESQIDKRIKSIPNYTLDPR